MMSTSQQIKLITLKQELYVPTQCTIYSKSQRLTLYDRDHVIFYSKLAGATTWPTLHFFTINRKFFHINIILIRLLLKSASGKQKSTFLSVQLTCINWATFNMFPWQIVFQMKTYCYDLYCHNFSTETKETCPY